ncbi:hypothetical protein [Cohnella sp. WQ 127256]|uniref:hypothetical protein n=1 Tax=Cohnella sp. WQ 127256 TaxID=2938790 RepID=UPI002118FD3D|nr:hypothetical protein [Cohnella sp. WQ 127256]
MADLTQNIGLKKPLDNEFADIGIINENMDKIDQSLGAMTAVPTTAKDVAGAITELHDNLQPKSSVPVVLKNGVQVIQGGDVSSIVHPEFVGRTLINLLGRDGNCEDTIKWKVTQTGGLSTIAEDVTYRVVGNKSIIVTGDTFNTFVLLYRETVLALDTNKNYLVVGHARSGLQANITVGTSAATANGGAVTNSVGGDSLNWSLMYAAFKPTISQLYISGNVAGTESIKPAAGFDAFRLYEIPASEKTKIDSMTLAQAQDYIVRNYPYVDDMKHVNAVYIENKGKNMLPDLQDGIWASSGPSSSRFFITGSYDLAMNVTDTSSTSTYTCDIPILINQTYTMKHNGGTGFIRVSTIKFAPGGAVVTDILTRATLISGESFTFTTPADAQFVRVQLFNINKSDVAVVGGFTFSNPTLNVGAVAPTFESQRPSYLYLPDVQLKSNVDGSVADQLYTDGHGKPRVTRRLKQMVLDGNIEGTAYDYPSFKSIVVLAEGGVPINKVGGTKYNGKILSFDKTAVEADSWGVASSNIHISVADVDSGWGEFYLPSKDEIKAYFWGWKMFDMNLNPSGVGTYDRTDGLYKSWTPIQSFSGSMFGCIYVGVGVPSLPPSSSNTNTLIKAQEYQYYRLLYQIDKSIDEPVNYEGSLMLHEGANQIEVGTGIVVREAARYTNSNGLNWVNNTVYATSLLYKVRSFVRLYKNANVELTSYRVTTGGAVHGLVQLGIYDHALDKTAAYSVTYLALDTCTLGIAPQSVNASYAPNIRGSIDSLVREVVEARTEVSVLQNTKVEKHQPQWITPTLLNGWVAYGGAGYPSARYLKDDLGFVHLDGLISGGIVTSGTPLFILPSGYRPKETVTFVTVSLNSTAEIITRVRVNISGEVVVSGSAGNVWLCLTVPPFRAG